MAQNTRTPPKPVTSAVQSNHGALASVEQIRGMFPALARRHNGLPVAYFDGPGGTQVPQSVVDAVSDYLIHHNANTHWNYPTSAETDAILDRARAAMADFVGGEPAEIVFGANATTLAFHASRTLGRHFQSTDELLITELDHHANVGPWQALAKERGCPLHVAKMNVETGAIDWADLEAKATSKTRLIAIGAASNALGTVNDIKRAAQLARKIGAWLFVDAVHYAPHFLVDVKNLGCDFLVCSAYKFYGPHIGAMWCRKELLESLPFPKVQPSSDTAPERAETGTLNHEGIAGSTAAIDFLASLAKGANRREQLHNAFAGLDRRSEDLTERMWNGLAELKNVKLYGPRPGEARTSTVAFTVQGVASSEVAQQLAKKAVFVSHGNFYAATVVERLQLGHEGLVRAGCACYTTADEVDRLIAGVRELQ